MERTKRIDNQTLIAVILSLLLVASLLLTVTGAWFKSTLDEIDGETADFGTIVLGEDAADLSLNMTEADVLMPGDDIDVDFNVVNSGTADMYVRFKLIFETDDAEYVTGATGATITANDGELDEVVYYRHDFGAEGFWYVRADASIGSLTPALNETDVIDETFLVPSDTSNSAQGTDVTISLYIQAIQAANNGEVYDPENAGYNVEWQEYTGPVESGGALLSITSSVPTNNGVDYTITNVSELGYIAEQTNLTNAWSDFKEFTLSGDIDLVGYEWVPIGTYENMFTGIFDGNGYTISNISINNYYTEIGFFGAGMESIIRNLSITGNIDVEIEPDIEGTMIGSIVGGVRDSNITNCNSNINITVDGDNTEETNRFLFIGGIFGLVVESTIEKCYNEGNLEVSSNIGEEVGALNTTSVGGIGGFLLNSTILYSYNTGYIIYENKAEDDVMCVGGLFGMAVGEYGLIYHCYTVGSITNQGIKLGCDGAAIGASGEIVLTDCYCICSGTIIDVVGMGEDNNITELTILEMQTEATFTNWDFTTVWDIEPLINDGYPTLR